MQNTLNYDTVRLEIDISHLLTFIRDAVALLSGGLYTLGPPHARRRSVAAARIVCVGP